MNVEYHKFYSSHLGREMEYKVYGHGGKPVLLSLARAAGSLILRTLR